MKRQQGKRGAGRTARRRRVAAIGGMTYIECLVASLIVGVSLAGVVSLWAFAFRMTATTDQKGIAYAVGRQALETVKLYGFDNAAEGAATSYYDGAGDPQASPASAAYQATVTVTSSPPGTPGQTGAGMDSYALRTVTVTVSPAGGGAALYQTGTYLVRYGI